MVFRKHHLCRSQTKLTRTHKLNTFIAHHENFVIVHRSRIHKIKWSWPSAPSPRTSFGAFCAHSRRDCIISGSCFFVVFFSSCFFYYFSFLLRLRRFLVFFLLFVSYFYSPFHFHCPYIATRHRAPTMLTLARQGLEHSARRGAHDELRRTYLDKLRRAW